MAIREFIVTKDILNLRSSPTDIDDTNYVSSVTAGTSLYLDDSPIIGKVPDGGTTNVWNMDGNNNVAAADGLTLSYDEKLVDFQADAFNQPSLNTASWGIVDSEVWRIWKKGYTGQGIKIAVIDMNFNENVNDINAAIKDPADFKNFVSSNPIPGDGHGTACASIISAQGGGMIGASPGASLIFAIVDGTDSMLKQAIEWACNERQANIVSISQYHTAGKSDPLDPDEQAVHDCIGTLSSTTLFFVCIGNDGQLAGDSASYPANYNGCYGIGAYGQGRAVWEDTPAIGSAFNYHLFAVAPGVGLKGYDQDGNLISLESATSYACPFAAGLIATIWSYYKTKNPQGTPADLISDLQFDKTPDNNPNESGNGAIRLNKYF